MTEPSETAIYVIGSINTDLVVKTDILPSPGQTVMGGDFFMNAGGKGGNQAVAAARLGGHVSMVGNLGTDLFGDAALTRLEREAIDCTHVSRDEDRPSGVALIGVDTSGENQIVVAPGANGTLTTSHVEQAFDAIPERAIVMLQLEIPLATVIRVVELAWTKRCQVVLDPAPAQPLPSAVIEGAYLITPNATEASLLTGVSVEDAGSAGRAATALLDTGAEHVAITLGRKGALLASRGGRTLIPAPTVDAVGATAAGDCFNGAVAVALARGRSLADSMAVACRAASLSVTRLGAQDSMPFSQDLV